MASSSEPQKKDGLRCDCGKLLLEKDPEMGFGVRCGRRECDKFHPLKEINRRAAELQKENKGEEMRKAMRVYTLHDNEQDFHVKGAVIARSPQEAASILGGQYIPPEGGIKTVSTDPDELNLRGRVRFSRELFREMSRVEKEVAGLFAGHECYTKGCFTLLSTGGIRDLIIREHLVLIPEYVNIPGI